MLTDQEFRIWCDTLRLPQPTREVISRIRTSEPQVRVSGGNGNVTVRFASQKMGRSIQAASHRVELPFILTLEHDNDVLEYYDRPSSIKLNFRAPSGRMSGINHIPDFFVIRKDGAAWVECHSEEKLKEIANKNPNRYVNDVDGNWSSSPGVEYASEFGLCYEVFSSRNINWVFQRNVEWLADYWDERCPKVEPEQQMLVQSILRANPGIVLSELLANENGITVDNVNALIAHGDIFVDLYASPLAEPERVQVFPDETTARAYLAVQTSSGISIASPVINLETGQRVIYDGKLLEIKLVGDTSILFASEDSSLVKLKTDDVEKLIQQGLLSGVRKVQDDSNQNQYIFRLLATASPDDLRRANTRFDAIKPYLDGMPIQAANLNRARSLRRWRKKYKEAEQEYGNGFVGLLPQYHNSGNRTARLPNEVRKLIQDVIETEYESLKQRNYVSAYRILQVKCQEKGLDTPSYRVFISKCKSRPKAEQTEKRKGSRAAYADEVPYLELELSTPRHGDRVWQICHIDHTQLDVELVSSKTKRNLGRPWATFMIDAYSRKLLVVYVSFDPPSYVTLMMVIRDCVRQYSRLPQYLVTDNGKEFESTYFETLLALYQCHKHARPPHKARFGSVCERLFGTSNTQLVNNLAGNTQIMKNVRQVTKSVNPKNHSIWTLGTLYLALQIWSKLYNSMEHPSLGIEPDEAYNASIGGAGERNHRLIAYDEAFILSTMPSTPKGTAKVQPNSGVRINYFDYWSEQMRHPEVQGKQVPVRYDPQNMGIAYAQLGGQWVKCISNQFAALRGRTERSIREASEELRRQRGIGQKNYHINAKELAVFVDMLDKQEEYLQQEIDGEAQPIIEYINKFRTDGEQFLLRESNDAISASDSTNQDNPIEVENQFGEPKSQTKRTRKTFGEW